MRHLEHSIKENIWISACTIVSYTNANNGGTFKVLESGEIEVFKPKFGYIVATTDNKTDLKEFNSGLNTHLTNLLEQASTNGGLVGTWLESDHVCIDSAIHIADEWKAIECAIKYNQRAIYDCEFNIVIELDDYFERKFNESHPELNP